MKNKGFTLIELLAVIVILAIIALIATPTIIGIIDNARKESFKSNIYGIIAGAENGIAKNILKQGESTLTRYEYVDSEETKKQGNINMSYNGKKPQNGTLLINEIGQTAVFLYENGYCAIKNFQNNEIVLEKIEEEECLNKGINYVYYNETQKVNRPQLTAGMTPIKWNGKTWVSTNTADLEWYDYSSSQKKWANAKTADGSMWVWIPRYIYKIPFDNWHTNVAATIDVQFSKVTDDNWNSANIGNIDLGITSEASKDKWTDHPAFWWDNDSDGVREVGEELTGIWVAKFEPSVEGTSCYGTYDKNYCNQTSLVPKSLPNKFPWRHATPDTFFTVGRNLEKNTIFGWGDSSNGIDTHMIKNVEWGAVAYLSNSIYGKNAEIWNNNGWPWVTGCAGNKADATSIDGCQNTYETINGQESSTTGNWYGIYDMVGGVWELTTSYVIDDPANLNPELRDYGANILAAEGKYKNVYNYGSPDDKLNNYNLTINHKGDAMYETSGSGDSWTGTWYDSESYMIRRSMPWLTRGGEKGEDAGSGIFCFGPTWGDTTDGWETTRYVIIVGEGF